MKQDSEGNVNVLYVHHSRNTKKKTADKNIIRRKKSTENVSKSMPINRHESFQKM
jgi:hypothetical protein